MADRNITGSATNSSSTSACGQCQHGGICNETTNKCVCLEGYHGLHCEKKIKIKQFNCGRDGGCENDGVCLKSGDCHCIRPYYGGRCEHVDRDIADWLHSSKKKENEKSVLVSVSLGVIFINAVCFIVICVSVRRSRGRQEEDEESSEHFVQVEGPPHGRRSIIGRRRSSGFEYRPAWYIPFHAQSVRRASRSREGMVGLHAVSTAPAILKGSQPPTYGELVHEDSGTSFATIQNTRLNSVPPGYDEATASLTDEEKEPLSPRIRLSTSSGLHMRTLPSTGSSIDAQRLASVSEAVPYDIEEGNEDDEDREERFLRTDRLTSIATSQCSSVFTDGEVSDVVTVEIETGL
ncbi:uncharacterized protein LOC144443208 [Glandiceps talaboti]